MRVSVVRREGSVSAQERLSVKGWGEGGGDRDGLSRFTDTECLVDWGKAGCCARASFSSPLGGRRLADGGRQEDMDVDCRCRCQ